MSNSPISMPDVVDKRPVPTVAVARATDAVVWALVECLLEKKLLAEDDLCAKLVPIKEQLLGPSGYLITQEDKERFATGLAIERVVAALKKRAG